MKEIGAGWCVFPICCARKCSIRIPTGLAYEFEYSDQMHLIKDFRHFLVVNPGDFVAEDFAF